MTNTRPFFSLAGSPFDAPPASRSVMFFNNSSRCGDTCLYQDPDDARLKRVAWLVKRSFPGTKLLFQWQEQLDFIWMETTAPGPDAQLTASQQVVANRHSRNRITLDYQGAHTFLDPRQEPEAGSLSIDTTAAVPPGMAYVGIGMAGLGTLVAPTQPNILYTFAPRSTYWITFGSYVQGTLMEDGQPTCAQRIDFPHGVSRVMAILGQDNRWTVTPYGDGPSMWGGAPAARP
jgi:rhizosphere induced protein